MDKNLGLYLEQKEVGPWSTNQPGARSQNYLALFRRLDLQVAAVLVSSAKAPEAAANAAISNASRHRRPNQQTIAQENDTCAQSAQSQLPNSRIACVEEDWDFIDRLLL